VLPFRYMCSISWYTTPDISCIFHQVKDKFLPNTDHEGPEEYRYSSTLSLNSALDGVGGQRHDPAVLPHDWAGNHSTGGWFGHRAGLDGCGNIAHTRVRSADRPVFCSESLYWLSYRTEFNIQQLHVLPTQCIYVFCVDLRTNSDYFPIQHWLTDL